MSDFNKMEKIISLCKRRGFIFQGSEIYGGLAGTWDFGPRGVALKRALEQKWWTDFIEKRPDMHGLDAAILMNRSVWESSGHADGFADPLVEDVKTKKRYRADHILEDAGIERAEALSPDEMTAKIKELELKSSDGNKYGEVKQFNLMFSTEVGAAEGSRMETFLRPETAQGIFTNYKNVLDSMRPKLPFGIGQIGKAFRNEITPRDWLFRVREFDQMEIEYFVNPDQADQELGSWKGRCWQWLLSVGVNPDNMRWYEHSAEERSHYSDATWDIQYKYPFSDSYKELWGVANRTNYDLNAHQTGSGTKLDYIDQATGEKLMPYVIEPSIGVGRLIAVILDSAYHEEKIDGDTRVVLRLPESIAPVQIAVLPLMKKSGLAEKAREVFEKLLDQGIRAEYDETGSIGKRYRRQDEIGTPKCVTIDFDTLEDNTVTIRDRDTLEQERVKISDL